MFKRIKKMWEDRKADYASLDDTDFDKDLWQSQIDLLEATTGTQNVVESLMQNLRMDLSDEKEKVKIVANALLDALITINGDGEILTFNRVAEGMFGWTSDEIKGCDIDELMPDGFRKKLCIDIERDKRTRSDVSYTREITAITKDGFEFPVEISVNKIDLSNEVNNYVAVVRDISERVETTKKLAESELKFRTLVESTDTGLVIVDLAGNVIDANESYFNLIGCCDLDEILGRNVGDWAEKSSLQSLKRAIKFCSEHGTVKNFETTVSHLRTLEDVDVAVDASVKDGKIYALCRNITVRKKAREALINSKKRYKRLISNLGPKHFLYTHDLDGIITYISPSAVDMLGYDEDELKSHYTTFLTDHVANDAVIEYTNLSIKGKQPPSYESEIYHKNGSKRWLRISKTPYYDSDGNLLGVEGIAQDITNFKANQDKNQILGAAMNESSDAVSVTDTAFNLIFVNKAFCEKYDFNYKDLMGRNLFSLFPHVSDTKKSEIINIIVNGVNWNGAVESIHKDGDTTLEEINILPIMNCLERPKFYISTHKQKK